MNEITFRKATLSDVEKLVELRQMQLQSEETTPTENLSVPLRQYFEESIADGSFISWLAVADGEIAATSGIAFYKVPPYYGLPTGNTAEVANMFTLPAYRRQGLAKKLLGMVLAEAKSRGCALARVSASKVGILFYTDYGFVLKDNFLTYRLGE